jgi:hypothetical protein
MHIVMGLFEVNEISGQIMVSIQFESLLSKFKLMHYVIVFVKEEGNNWITISIALHSIINYEPLELIKVYEYTCFGHVMSNMACQYAINDNTVSKGSTCVKRCTSYYIKNDYMAKKSKKKGKNQRRLALKMRCNLKNL